MNARAAGVRRFLGHRGAPLAWAALAVALTLPSLRVGLVMDDWLLRATVLRSPALRDILAAPGDLFALIDRHRIRSMIDRGILPWWIDERMRIAFWRPLTTWTHVLDYSVWKDSPAIMHGHSLAWLALLVAAAGYLYRRISAPAWVAGLAGLLYAVDDAHGFAAGWLANRNVLVATFFATLCLFSHDRWRRHAWRPGAALAPAFLLAALLSSEAAVATGAYLLAHAIFLDTAGIRGRLVGLLPSATVASAWLVTHRWLGYGALDASPLYVNPVREPVELARALVERGPILLAAQWFRVPAEAYERLAGPEAWARWLASVAALALLGLALRPILRADATARFWGAGHVLAVVPVTAALLDDRHLFFVGLGAMGLAARFLAGVLEHEPAWTRPAWRRVAATAIAGALIAIHLLAAPLRLPIAAAAPGALGRLIDGPALTLPEDPELARQTVVIPLVPGPGFFFYTAFVRAAADRPVPTHMRVLMTGAHAVTLSRLDARTLLVRPVGGMSPLALLFWRRDAPPPVGRPIRLTGTSIEVARLTSDGLPAEIVFRFDVDLEAPSLRWLRWQWHEGQGRYVPFSPPGIGETVSVQ